MALHLKYEDLQLKIKGLEVQQCLFIRKGTLLIPEFISINPRQSIP